MPNGGATSREEVYAAISGERTFHTNRYPRGEKPEFSIGEELLLIEEYACKARKAWSREVQGETFNTLNAIRKIAALAVRCMEKHGAPRRAKPGCEHTSGPVRCSECAYNA